MNKLSIYVFNRFIKDKPIEARLIKRGYKPHYSNIKHLILGLAIASGAGSGSLLVFAKMLSPGINLLLSLVAGLAAASLAGYVKEVYDKRVKKVFDRLDLLATVLGGGFYCILASLIFMAYLITTLIN